jgi:hypothetical protein
MNTMPIAMDTTAMFTGVTIAMIRWQPSIPEWPKLIITAPTKIAMG